MERVILLVTDLDGTLLGDEQALVGFIAWYDRAKERLRLVYSSGRFPPSVRESIVAHRLPEPDAIIGGVGTEIQEFGAAERLVDWPPISSHWDPGVVRMICARHDELEDQSRDLVSQYKISYYSYDLDNDYLEGLERELVAAGQEATLVYSSNRDLDILPAHTNKGAAAAFLADRWQIDRERVIVAGDSGNDLAMFKRGFRGIVVGNAHPELKSLVDPGIYHATGQYATGVLEGLQHWLRD